MYAANLLIGNFFAPTHTVCVGIIFAYINITTLEFIIIIIIITCFTPQSFFFTPAHVFGLYRAE